MVQLNLEFAKIPHLFKTITVAAALIFRAAAFSACH